VTFSVRGKRVFTIDLFDAKGLTEALDKCLRANVTVEFLAVPPRLLDEVYFGDWVEDAGYFRRKRSRSTAEVVRGEELGEFLGFPLVVLDEPASIRLPAFLGVPRHA